MSNEYYTHTGSPTTNADGDSSVMRAEFASIQTGLDKLPALASNGDKAVFVNAGGTALTAVTAATARTNIGAQVSDATLTSLAALGTTADRVAYTTGVDTWAETPLTAAGRALIDDASAAAQRTTLGVVIGADVQAFDATLTSLSALGTAADKIAYTTGVDTWAEAPITAGGRALLQSVVALKTSDQLNIGTAYADVTGTGLAVAANTTYAFEFNVIADADASTTGIDVSCNGPAGATSITYSIMQTATANSMTFDPANAYNFDTSNTGSAGTTAGIYTLRGILVNGATAGTLIARAKREAVGSGPNVRAGSYGILTKLS